MDIHGTQSAISNKNITPGPHIELTNKKEYYASTL